MAKDGEGSDSIQGGTMEVNSQRRNSEKAEQVSGIGHF